MKNVIAKLSVLSFAVAGFAMAANAQTTVLDFSVLTGGGDPDANDGNFIPANQFGTINNVGITIGSDVQYWGDSPSDGGFGDLTAIAGEVDPNTYGTITFAPLAGSTFTLNSFALAAYMDWVNPVGPSGYTVGLLDSAAGPTAVWSDTPTQTALNNTADGPGDISETPGYSTVVAPGETFTLQFLDGDNEDVGPGNLGINLVSFTDTAPQAPSVPDAGSSSFLLALGAVALLGFRNKQKLA